MRVLLLSDIHLHNHQQFATILPNGRNSRLQHLLNVVDEARRYAEQKKVDAVFVLGDVFHTRKTIDVDVYQSAWEALCRLCTSVRHAFILVGNHDQYDKAGLIHALRPFRAFATVIDLPVLMRVDDLTFAAHPFTTTTTPWKQFVKCLPKGLDFFFFHQGLSEATIGAFDIAVRAEVELKDLPADKARYIWGGHYHKHQTFLGGRGGYVGSPAQHNFGEREEEKGFVFIDTDIDYAEFVKTNAPRFRLLSSESFWQAVDHNSAFLATDYIRVQALNDREAQRIKENYSRVQVEVLSQPDYERERRLDTNEVSTDEELLQLYIDAKDPKAVDRNRLFCLGREMLVGDGS